MDDAPYTGDLNLAAVRTRDDLLAVLRTVYIRADKPALRTLEARTRHSASPLSKNTVAEMLHGVRFPRKAVMVAFVRACGIPDEETEPWRRAWEQVAASEEASAQSGTGQSGTAQAAHEREADAAPAATQNAADQASLLKEISMLRGILASVAESSATPGSSLDVLIRASIGTLLNEHGEVSITRLLREIAHRLPDASPAAISSSLEELRRAGKVSWLGDDVMKAGVIRVHP
jgi:hypothetical protein